MFRVPHRFFFLRLRPRQVNADTPVLDYESPNPQPDDDHPPRWEELLHEFIGHALCILFLAGVFVISYLW